MELKYLLHWHVLPTEFHKNVLSQQLLVGQSDRQIGEQSGDI
jgi:hypothetical protein